MMKAISNQHGFTVGASLTTTISEAEFDIIKAIYKDVIPEASDSMKIIPMDADAFKVFRKMYAKKICETHPTVLNKAGAIKTLEEAQQTLQMIEEIESYLV